MRLFESSRSTVSSILAVCLMVTTVPLPAQTTTAIPSFVQQLSIPRALGTVTSFKQPTRGVTPVVVLIQDLHLHYPTQKRILKILNHLYARGIASGPVAVEGVQGPYDTSVLASYPAGPAKARLIDYLMKKGEVSGDEAFAMLRNENRRLYGVDDSDYYRMNHELYRATHAGRQRLLLPLDNLSRKLESIKRDGAQDSLKEAEHSLLYLKRLVRQEATLEDARYVAQRLPAFVAVTEKMLAINQTTGISTDEIREILKSTVDYYTVALLRDAPLAKNTLSLLSSSKQAVIPLVVGGFHTAGMTRAFENAGVGYVVITPHLDDVSAEYRRLYSRRMMGKHEAEITTAANLGLKAPISVAVPVVAEASVCVRMDKPYVAAMARWAYPALGIGLLATFMTALDQMPGLFELSAVVSGLKLAGFMGFPAVVTNPFRTTTPPAVRPTPIPAERVSVNLFDAADNEFSLMEAETVAAAAAVHRAGLIGLAGKILKHAQFEPGKTTQEEVVQFLTHQLEMGEGEWDVPHAIRTKIVDHARENAEFNPQKPQKLIVAAIKDVADAEAHDAITSVNEKVYRRSARGLSRWFAASEGLGRDALADGEAFGGGEILEVSARHASPHGGAVDRIEQAVGLLPQQFTIVDAIEGTNALVGVKEEGLAFKPGDSLPPRVEVVDISGATSVSLNVHGARQDLNLLNADDGYAHVIATQIPEDRRSALGPAPLDPDQPDISFARIRQALGGLAPNQIDVLVMNRPREKQKIQWLSEQGYHVSLIPDGTLIPSIYGLMGGKLHPHRHLVVWTTSGAPESRWGQSAEKALFTFGAVGGVRLYPKNMGKAADWMKEVGLTDDDLALYMEIKNEVIPKGKNAQNSIIEAFDRRTVSRGSFSFKEIKLYEQLHPEDWQDVVQLKRLYAASEINGEIDGAVAFVTDNPVFQLPGVRASGNGQIKVHVLRIRDGKIKIQSILGDPDALATGEAAVAEMQQRFDAAVHAITHVEDVTDTIQGNFTAPQLARMLNVHPRVASLALERLVDENKFIRQSISGADVYSRHGDVRNSLHRRDVLALGHVTRGSTALPEPTADNPSSDMRSVSSADRAVPVSFGTSGWRGLMVPAGTTFKDGRALPAGMDGFTVDNVSRVAQAIAETAAEDPDYKAGLPIGVAYDARPRAREFALRVLEVLRANDIRAEFSDQILPTPVSAEMTRTQLPPHLRLSLAVHLTASHNPFLYTQEELVDTAGEPVNDAMWLGVKLMKNGRPASDHYTATIARRANDSNKNENYKWKPLPPEVLQRITNNAIHFSNLRLAKAFQFDDPHGFVTQVNALYESGRLTRHVWDVLHGGTSLQVQKLVKLMREKGLKLPMDVINTRPMSEGSLADYPDGHPIVVNEGHDRFRLWGPEPSPVMYKKKLDPHMKPGVTAGILDGDGDRAEFYDMDGKTTLSPNVLGVIFAHFLLSRGGTNGKQIRRTLPTTRNLDLLAKLFKLPLRETPVGSKHFVDDDSVVDVEESGHMFMKIGDETFADSAIAQVLLSLRILAETGKSLKEYYDDIVIPELKTVGNPLIYNRTAVTASVVTEPFKAALRALRTERPEAFADALSKSLGKTVSRIDAVTDANGILVEFEDGSWTMYRLSGTDGSVRIYGEETDLNKLRTQELTVEKVLIQLAGDRGPLTGIAAKLISGLLVLGVGLGYGALPAVAQTNHNFDGIFYEANPLLVMAALIAAGMFTAVIVVLLQPIMRDWSRRRRIRERDRQYARTVAVKLKNVPIPDVATADKVVTPAEPSNVLQNLVSTVLPTPRQNEAKASLRRRAAELLHTSA